MMSMGNRLKRSAQENGLMKTEKQGTITIAVKRNSRVGKSVQVAGEG